MSKLVPTKKQLKESAIDGVELLGGICAAYGIRTQIKSDKKWINPLAALLAFYFHSTSTNRHIKGLALGSFGYFGLKSLSDLKKEAVAGLQGVEGMEGVTDLLNKLVPNLGEAETEMLTGSELAAAEEELLGLLGASEFSEFKEISSKPLNTTANDFM